MSASLLKELRGVLVETVGDVGPEAIGMKTDLRRDLGVDSILAVEIAAALSGRLGYDLPLERWFTEQVETDDYSIESLLVFIEQQHARAVPETAGRS